MTSSWVAVSRTTSPTMAGLQAFEMFATCETPITYLATRPGVLKPRKQTTLSALAMEELLANVRPGGVMTIVVRPSRTARSPVRHSRVRRAWFIGAHPQGAQSNVTRAETGNKDVTLELGCKHAMIVFLDADLSAA